ncbi:MAG: alpha/beta fold hydrolase [Roseomonas sp.]|nr:alpha/beta fold hydrolase [Roseomonas sp.]MCA3457739.1 alpha/beta fold hydrolase [Rhodobacter sp.]MCA3328036.1 alpha/beta fold hydrolase [Roseomonas sp.]MCA3332871.1 alpha/beta fold hydrolase [Roseomonas sp.]MCA3335054.1 alpha/beta fold hydrolase [Roseomonas sp.]
MTPLPAEARAGALRWLSPAGFFTLRWLEWGPVTGAPVVCVHGLTRSGRDFDSLARALAASGRRVFCPDLPGRGASDWLPDPALYQPPIYSQALAHLLARIDGPVDWVGTSLGGICGMGIAATPGNAIRRMVLNDVGAIIPAAALQRIRDYINQPAQAFPDIAALESHLRKVHAPFGPLTDTEWRHLAETSARKAATGALQLHYDPKITHAFSVGDVADIDLSLFWAAIAIPVLILRGVTSDILPAEIAAEMARKPKARLLEIADAGHAPALMAQDQIAAIQDFLNTP